MIFGIGLDIVKLNRIETAYKRRSSFAKRILTDTEWRKFNKLNQKRKIEFLAGRFSAKEAYAKALGCGIGEHVSFQGIEVQLDKGGKPSIYDQKRKDEAFTNHLSITHTNEYAAAQVVIEKMN